MSTIQGLQFALLLVGIGGSLFTAWKIGQRSSKGRGLSGGIVPHLAVLMLFAAVNVYLFTLPMAHRV